jgi:ubiquinone/menaquinone biosynthesis C-methylase UbiE
VKNIIFLICMSLSAQVAEKANENYKTKEGRAGVASGLGSASRDARQKPKELIAALDLKPGMVVADVGTGAGYMLPHLSEAVGPSGKVIAEDIYPDFVEAAKKTAGGLKNIEFVLCSEKATNLPPGSADVIFVLDAYHHFNYPQELLADFQRALKKDGRLIIVEYHKSQEAMANGRALEHIRLSADNFIKEIEGAGWKLASRKEFIPRVQWIGIFQALK